MKLSSSVTTTSSAPKRVLNSTGTSSRTAPASAAPISTKGTST